MKLWRIIITILITVSLTLSGLAASAADGDAAVTAGDEAAVSVETEEETESAAASAEEEIAVASMNTAKHGNEEKPEAKPEPAKAVPKDDKTEEETVLPEGSEDESELPGIPEEKVDEPGTNVTNDGSEEDGEVTGSGEETDKTDNPGTETGAEEDETANPEEKLEPADTDSGKDQDTPEKAPETPAEKPAEEPQENPAEDQPAQEEDEEDTAEIVITENLTINQSWSGVIKRKTPTILKLDLSYAQTVHMLVEGKNVNVRVCKADRNPEDAPGQDTDPETDQTVVTWSAEAGSYLISLSANEGSLLAKVQVSFLNEEEFSSLEANPAETEKEETGAEEEAGTPGEEPEKPEKESSEGENQETEGTKEEEIPADEEPAGEEIPALQVLTEDELAEQGFLTGAVIREEGAALYGTMEAETEPAAWLEAGTTLFVKIEDDTWGRIQTVTDEETVVCGFMKLDELALTTDGEQAEKLPVRTIRVVSSLDDVAVVTVGTEVELKAELSGFSAEDHYTVQWQYTPDGGKTVKDAEGADGLTYRYRVDKTNYTYGWRVKVTLAPAEGPAAEPVEESTEEAAE